MTFGCNQKAIGKFTWQPVRTLLDFELTRAVGGYKGHKFVDSSGNYVDNSWGKNGFTPKY